MFRSISLCIAAALFALTGCVRTYPTPEVDRASNFAGVRDLVAPGETARLILSHGMCSAEHDFRWVLKRFNQIARFVGDGNTTKSSEAQLEDSVKYSKNGAVQIYNGKIIGSGDRTYHLSFFVWGRAVDDARENLAKDSGRAPEEGQPRRALVNNALKSSLMNKCLIDAVFYLGPSGDVIREGTRELWCEFLGGNVTSSSGRLDETTKCSVGALRPNSNSLSFLVPESLGSKVLFDGFRQVNVSGVSKARALGPVGGIHLVTNQVLLLDQAGLTSSELKRLDDAANQSSLASFLSEVQPATTILRTKDATSDPRVPIVAYTDPNDVLGYRLFDDQNPDCPSSEVLGQLAA